MIRFLLPLTWRLSSSQRVRVLLEFAQTELDSAWQSIFALERVRDPLTRELLLQHAFEELFHADLFNRLAQEKADSLPSLPLTRRDPIFSLSESNSKNAVEFLAFLAIGEREINDDFAVYQKSLTDPQTQRILKTIREDEVWHAKDSDDALVRLATNNRVNLKWIRARYLLKLAYKRYLSLMNKVGSLPMGALLFVSYAIFGPIFYHQARRRLRMSNSDQLELLARQKSDLDSRLGAIS